MNSLHGSDINQEESSLKRKVLFDINVLLDVIENRVPHIAHSGPALHSAEKGEIQGYIAASSVDTLAFLIRKSSSIATTYSVLTHLLQILDVLPVDKSIISTAIAAKWDDPEDAILYYTAISGKCDYLLTRNERDFDLKSSDITVLSPEKYLKGHN
jgi:predicted nucleic acid-binding protein